MFMPLFAHGGIRPHASAVIHFVDVPREIDTVLGSLVGSTVSPTYFVSGLSQQYVLITPHKHPQRKTRLNRISAQVIAPKTAGYQRIHGVVVVISTDSLQTEMVLGCLCQAFGLLKNTHSDNLPLAAHSSPT